MSDRVLESFVFPAAPAGNHPQKYFAWPSIQELVAARRTTLTRLCSHFGGVDLEFALVHVIGRRAVNIDAFLDNLVEVYLENLSDASGEVPVTVMGPHLTVVEDQDFDRFLGRYKITLPLYEGLKGEELLNACPALRFEARQEARIDFNRRLEAAALRRGWQYNDVNEAIADGLRVLDRYRPKEAAGDVHLDSSVLSLWVEELDLLRTE